MAQRQNDDNAIWILLLLGGLAWLITRRSQQPNPAPPAADPFTTEPQNVKPSVIPETATPTYMSKNELETYIQATGDTDMKKNWSLYNPIDFVAIQPE